MKFEGSSGPENSGVRKDHTTINEKNAAPTLNALRVANFFTTPIRPHLAQTQLRLRVLATSTCPALGLQLLCANGHELP